MNPFTENVSAPGTVFLPRLLQDRICHVLTDGYAIGTALAAGLADQGARVALLCDVPTDDRAPAAAPASAPDAAFIATDFSSRPFIRSALERAEQQTGPADVLAFCFMPAAALVSRPLCATSDAQWDDGCRAAQRIVLRCLQEALPRMAPRRGTIVGIGPSLSINGAAGLVALTAALEGQRALLKSAARQWAGRGITANWIMLHPHALSPVFHSAQLAFRPDRIPVALDPLPQLRRDIAPAIAFLGSAAGKAITGETLFMDGGEWMIP